MTEYLENHRPIYLSPPRLSNWGEMQPAIMTMAVPNISSSHSIIQPVWGNTFY